MTSSDMGLTWDEVSARMREDDRGKEDCIVPRDEIQMHDGMLSIPRRYGLAAGTGRLNLNEWATTQLCQRLEIPTGYFRRCPTSLRDIQVNHWLRNPDTEKSGRDSDGKESRFLLRARGATLRGFLTERYSPVGNSDLLRVLAPVLKDTGYGVRWLSLSDESLHLRLTDERRWKDILPGDAVVAGLHLANSEVGKRRVTVDTLVWRLVCRNGLIALVKGRSLFAARHVGGLSLPELGDKLPDIISRAVAEGEKVIERMVRATQVRLSDPQGVIATIASDWRLSQAMEDRIIKALLAEGLGQQDTLYGLVNAVTNVAQALSSSDDRYAMEALAGVLLEKGPPAVRATSRTEEQSVSLIGPSHGESNAVPLGLFSTENMEEHGW